ncbi:CysZ protein [Malonomonas rubra DSM 5091]|uniref:CysZ protein n=1 Tax=Malonomonas rubra DSM 5091 TaxID=1122189 RepID=A0A1M6BNZ1_MALRU|nr:EI24 domain-containing protein [Malonomonas rubra]SHI50471.1 CysZ protein [Malonomonas rubra DSM 5091]
MIGKVASATIKPVAGFTRGFSYPLRAAKFLSKRPGLLRYLAIPFAINVLVFSISVYYGLDLFQGLLETYAPNTEVWYGAALYYLAWTVAMLLTSVVVFFTFTVVGNLIASPFNELLSEHVEALKVGRKPDERFSVGRFWKEAKNSIFVEIKKMSVFIICMVLLLGINLIPGVGSMIYAVLAPMFTLFFLVVEYMAFVLMRKQLTFTQQRRYITKRPVLMIGYGCGIFCLLTIPFVQFFCIPLAVVGATLLWCDFPREASE